MGRQRAADDDAGPQPDATENLHQVIVYSMHLAGMVPQVYEASQQLPVICMSTN
jgi:hypothetical protein